MKGGCRLYKIFLALVLIAATHCVYVSVFGKGRELTAYFSTAVTFDQMVSNTSSPITKDATAFPANKKENTTAQNICQDYFKEIFDREKRFLCFNLTAGIGNIMFAHASVYGMATAANKMVVTDKNNILVKYFRVKAQLVSDICSCDDAQPIREVQHCAFNPFLMQLNENRNYKVGHYLQSWKYFHHVSEDIRRQFTFKEEQTIKTRGLINEKAKRYLSKKHNYSFQSEKPSSITFVGVHVRRGGIASDPLLKEYGYIVPPAGYFAKTMSYFRNKYSDTLFFVCSDDMTWCQQNIKGSDVMYMEGNDVITDLAILSPCNHSIISVGTYGWWAANLLQTSG